jgi:hypothetical protein
MYQELQSAYAAGVGFNSKSASWQATRITFGDELRESGEKDPNIEAVGIGGQIYGKRADMIIVDDAVTLSNANDFERQIKWLTQDVRSRLNPTGKLIIIGTRVASVDLYKELRNEDRYPGGLVPWKYLAMPALLTVDEDPDKWETLWPYSDAPFDGQEENELTPDGYTLAGLDVTFITNAKLWTLLPGLWFINSKMYQRTHPLTQYVFVVLLMVCVSPVR